MTLELERLRRPFVVCAGLVLCAFAPRAAAHDPFEVTTTAIVGAESLTIVATMTRSSAALASGLEAGANAFTPEHFARYEPRLRAAGRGFYEVRSNGEQLQPRAARSALNAENEVEFHVIYPRPRPGSLRLHASGLSLLSDGHGNAVRLVQGQPETVIALEFLNASDPVLEAWLPAEDSGAVAAPLTPPDPFAASFIELGLSHILTGYDHLLFLGGLLLACRRMRSMFGMISCFTVAHSLTLALAVMDRVPAVISAWVEPLVLASVVFVGVQNVWLPDEPRFRYSLTFGFGLIHGLGFASALTDLGLGAAGSTPILPLLSFNLGVELGQMLIASIALPLLLELRRSSRWPAVVRSLSLAIASVGAYWLIAGVLFA